MNYRSSMNTVNSIFIKVRNNFTKKISLLTDIREINKLDVIHHEQDYPGSEKC